MTVTGSILEIDVFGFGGYFLGKQTKVWGSTNRNVFI